MEGEGRPHQFEAALDKGGGQSELPKDPHSQTRIANAAKELGVPSVLLETHEAKEYLGFHNELGDIQEGVAEAISHLSIVEPEDVYTPPTLTQSPTDKTRSFACGKKRNISPGIAEVLRSNYEHTVPYLKVAQMLTAEGLDIHTLSPETLRNTLNPALAHMNLYIEDEPSDYDITPVGWMNGNFTSEYYDTRVWPHNKEYENIHKEAVAQREAKDENLKYFLIGTDPETKLFTPHGQWLYAPRIHEYTAVINAVIQATSALREARDNSPKESEEYMWEDAQRFDRIAAIVALGYESLLEGMNGHHSPPLKFIKDLNYILDPYQVHVDVKPIDIHATVEDHENSADIKRRIKEWQREQHDKEE